MPSWSEVIVSKIFTNESADVYACGLMNFRSDTVLSKSPNFMDFGLLSVNTLDELSYIFIPTTRIVGPTNGSNWLPPCIYISEATAYRVSGTKAKKHYNFKSEFETRKDKMVDQDFGRQNYPMSRPTLDSTHLGMNKTDISTSPIDSIPVGTKTTDPTSLTLPMEFPEKKGKAHVPGDLDPDPSLSYLSSEKSTSSNDSNFSRSIKKKRD